MSVVVIAREQALVRCPTCRTARLVDLRIYSDGVKVATCGVCFEEWRACHFLCSDDLHPTS